MSPTRFQVPTPQFPLTKEVHRHLQGPQRRAEGELIRLQGGPAHRRPLRKGKGVQGKRPRCGGNPQGKTVGGISETCGRRRQLHRVP